VDGRRLKGKDSTAMGEAKGLENLHLVTYHIPQPVTRTRERCSMKMGNARFM